MKMKTLFVAMIAVFLIAGCTIKEDYVIIRADEGGTVSICDNEILAEIKKGDESQNNAPAIAPTLSIPLLP